MTPEQSASPAVARGWLDRSWFVGAAAVALAVSMVVENVVLAATGAASYGSPMKEVQTYYAANLTAVGIVSGLVAVYLVLLLVVVAGLQNLVQQRGAAGAGWSRLAVAAGATQAATFVLVNVLQMGLALSAGGPGEPSPAFELIWHVHAAAFALTLPMIGATFLGATLAAHASGLTPSWQRVLGLAGAALLLAAGVAGLAIAEGSSLIAVGLAGVAAWLVWLLVTGVRLIRSGRG